MIRMLQAAIIASAARMVGDVARDGQQQAQLDQIQDMLQKVPQAGLLDPPQGHQLAADGQQPEAVLLPGIAQALKSMDSSAVANEFAKPEVAAPLRAYAVMDLMENPQPGVVIDVYHRGAWGPDIPENSLASQDKAQELGAHVIEIDVRLDADDIPISAHNPYPGGWADLATHQGKEPFDKFDLEKNQDDINPPFTDIKYSDLEKNNVRLMDINGKMTDQKVSTLVESVQHAIDNDHSYVIALDIKDNRATEAVIKALAPLREKNGLPALERIILKGNSYVYPTPDEFKQKHSTTYIDSSLYPDKPESERKPDWHYVKFMPVFVTANIGSKAFDKLGGGEPGVLNSAMQYLDKDQAPFVIGPEVGLKQPGGILASVADLPDTLNRTFMVGKFMPTSEYLNASNPEVPHFHYPKGTCCFTLAERHFKGAEKGLRSDTDDRRHDPKFILGNDRNIAGLFVTTDNIDILHGEVDRMGMATVKKYFEMCEDFSERAQKYETELKQKYGLKDEQLEKGLIPKDVCAPLKQDLTTWFTAAAQQFDERLKGLGLDQTQPGLDVATAKEMTNQRITAEVQSHIADGLSRLQAGKSQDDDLPRQRADRGQPSTAGSRSLTETPHQRAPRAAASTTSESTQRRKDSPERRGPAPSQTGTGPKFGR